MSDTTKMPRRVRITGEHISLCGRFGRVVAEIDEWTAAILPFATAADPEPKILLVGRISFEEVK